jgi:hypothetical protein
MDHKVSLEADTRTNRWSGIKVAILALDEPSALALKEAFSFALGIDKKSIYSGFKYDDIYQMCKQCREVALIVLVTPCLDGPWVDIFSGLSRHYEVRGFPCFGLILYSDSSLKEVLSFAQHSKVIGYFPLTVLLDKKWGQEIFNSFFEHFESLILPKPLRLTLLGIAGKYYGKVQLATSLRLINLLMNSSQLSWIQQAAIKWAPVLSIIQKQLPEALADHEILKFFVRMSDDSVENLEFDSSSEVTHIRKLLKFVEWLSIHSPLDKTTQVLDRWFSALPESSRDDTFVSMVKSNRGAIEQIMTSTEI